MAQFDVYRMAGGELVLDIQTGLIAAFRSRVVVPLMSAEDAPVAHARLNPKIVVGGKTLIMVTQFMIAVDDTELEDVVGNALASYDQIKQAYDMLFNGY